MHRRSFLLAASAAAGGAAASAPAGAQENASSTTSTGTPGGNATGGNASGNATGNTSAGNASGNATGGGAAGGGSTKQVVVGPGGDFVFEPEELTIAPGTAVEFVWESDGHNVAPEEGDWGHLPIEDTGFSFTTPPFEETGSFPYVCEPHASAGMEGTIEVAEGGGGGDGGGSEEADPEEMGVPFQAHFVGIATLLMMTVTFVYTFFVLKYGESPRAKGGD
jgi:plastocyanin